MSRQMASSFNAVVGCVNASKTVTTVRLWPDNRIELPACLYGHNGGSDCDYLEERPF